MNLTRRYVLTVVGGICAVPIYWLELGYVFHLVVQPIDLAEHIALGGAILLATLTVWAWWRSVRLGAIVQILLLLPVIIALASIFPEEIERARWGGGIDIRVAKGLLVLAVIPGMLLAFALIALRRRSKDR